LIDAIFARKRLSRIAQVVSFQAIMVSDPEDDRRPGASVASEPPRASGGAFQVAHRGGTRVEIAEPVHVGGDRPWMCAVKLVGRGGPGEPVEGEPTHTMLLRMGRGATPDDARRDGLAQLTLVYGSPVEPPPAPRIVNKKSDPPAPPDPAEGQGPGWVERLARRFKR
jgi:hypothetical protein